MLKDSFLKHAIGSRDHPKLVEAERASRGLFKAIWWDLVDMLWEQGGYLPMDFDKLAYILRYPTPEEVRSVVTDFGLFENDGERIWNESALESIQHMEEVSARNAENRRGKRTAGTKVEGTINDCSTDDKGTINDCSTNEERSSDRKKERKIDKRDISLLAADAEKADIYRLFFFKNFRNPEGELQRFLDRYEGNWTRTGSTRPEPDHMKLARSWKPETAEPRFKDPETVDWLKRFTAHVVSAGVDADAFLHAIDTMTVGKDYSARIVMKDTAWRDRILGTAEALDSEALADLIAPYKAVSVTCSKP